MIGRPSRGPSLGTAARLGFALAASCLAILFAASAPASAAGGHAFDPLLSLTGGTAVSKLDTVPDPGSLHPPKPFKELTGVAVDPAGYVYVDSWGEQTSEQMTDGRIDVFNPAGEFLTEISDPYKPEDVAVDGEGNVYVNQESDLQHSVVRFSPSSYPPTESVTFQATPIAAGFHGALAVDQADGHLFVNGGSGVAEYSSAPEGNTLVRNGIGEGVLNAGKGLAVDASTGNLYVSSLCAGCPAIPDEAHRFVSVVQVLDSSGALIATIDGAETPAGGFKSPFGDLYVAVDEESGEVVVSDVLEGHRVYRFVANGGDYTYAPDRELEEHSFGGFARIAVSNGATSDTEGNVYVASHTTAADHLYAFTPPGAAGPPVISGSAATEATATEARLQASVDPNGSATEYRFELVDDATYRRDVGESGTEHGFDHAIVVGEGFLPAGASSVPISALASGLQPGTTYRFRVASRNHCLEAEPEAPCDATGETVSFATYPASLEVTGCPNQALRVGVSASLPDCRAYELVSPPDTNAVELTGAWIGVGSAGRFNTALSSPAGNSLLYMTSGGSLSGDLSGSGVTDGYEALRGPSGWETHLAGPTGAQSQQAAPGGAAPDHGYWLWETGASADHGSLVLNGEVSQYVRGPDGEFDLIGAALRAAGNEIAPRFVTSSGAVIFTADLPSASAFKEIYKEERSGTVQQISVEPGGGPFPAEAQVEYQGASADGSAVAFSVTEGEARALYLYREGTGTELVAEGPATFAGLADDGSRLTYLQGGNIFSFQAASGAAVPVGSGGASTPVNVAASGGAIYFVSTKVLGGAKGAGTGKENFYVWDAATNAVRFIGVLTEQDVVGTQVGPSLAYGLGLWTQAVGPEASPTVGLATDPSRTTPDGAAIVFESRAPLTGYDSGGKSEVYRYGTAARSLACLSCSPVGLPATGDAHLQAQALLEPGPLTAGLTPAPNLSADGRKAFFQTPDALTPADVDGKEDVYEWEADGAGGCDASSGCLSLISSGHSDLNNYLYAVDPSGSDVFFASGDQLTPADESPFPSIYDARENGGFPEEIGPPCVAEACRTGSGATPSLPVPASEAVGKSGNVSTHRRRCRRARSKARQGAGRCRHRKRHGRGGHSQGGRR